MDRTRGLRFVTIAGVGLAALALAGCASSYGVATEKIAQADKAVASARMGNASLDASAELKVAEDKLAEAKAAFARNDHGDAARLAEQADVDAGYAGAKASTEKLRKLAREMRQNIQILRQELERLPQ